MACLGLLFGKWLSSLLCLSYASSSSSRVGMSTFRRHMDRERPRSRISTTGGLRNVDNMVTVPRLTPHRERKRIFFTRNASLTTQRQREQRDREDDLSLSQGVKHSEKCKCMTTAKCERIGVCRGCGWVTMRYILIMVIYMIDLSHNQIHPKYGVTVHPHHSLSEKV